jgi:hypothetical protein
MRIELAIKSLGKKDRRGRDEEKGERTGGTLRGREVNKLCKVQLQFKHIQKGRFRIKFIFVRNGRRRRLGEAYRNPSLKLTYLRN